MIEQWRPVVGYEGTYEVSSLGRVRSVDRVDRLGRHKKGVLLAQHPNAKGRLEVNLRGKTHRTHLVVLCAFKGPCPPGLEGCHNDGDHTNNAETNLRWGTRASNTLDSVKQGTHAQARKTHCPEGHELTAENITRASQARGTRHCLVCARAKSLASYYRRTSHKPPNDRSRF